MKKITRVIGIIIKAAVIAYLFLFSLNNKDAVSVKFPFADAIYNMPMFLLILLVLFTGFILGVLMMLGGNFSLKSSIKKLGRQSKEYQEEITRLKNITISGGNEGENNSVQKTSSRADQDIKNILR